MKRRLNLVNVDREARPFPGGARRLDQAVVPVDNPFDQAQPQAQSFFIAALVAAVKAVPNSGEVFGGNPRAVVFDRDDDLTILPAGGGMSTTEIQLNLR